MASSSSAAATVYSDDRRLSPAERLFMLEKAAGELGDKDPEGLFDLLWAVEGWNCGLHFPPQFFRNVNITAYCFGDKGESPALEPDNQVFFGINTAISLLKRAIDIRPLSDEQKEVCRKIITIYENFVKKVCVAKGAERQKLMVGPVYLILHLHGQWTCRLLSQQDGRALCSMLPDGTQVKKNTSGLSAVAQLGMIFAKTVIPTATRSGELNLCAERTAFELAKVTQNKTSTPARFAILENIYIDPTTPPPGTDMTAWLQSNPLPSEEISRNRRLLQLKLEERGPSLRDLLDPDFEGNVRDRLEDPRLFRHFFHSLVFQLLTQDGDGTDDNIMRSEGVLKQVDPEKIFAGLIGQMADVSRSSDRPVYRLEMRSMPCVLPAMMRATIDPADSAVVRTLDVECAIINFVNGLMVAEREYKKLLQQGLISPKEYEECNLAMKIKSHALPYLCDALLNIQKLLTSSTVCTGWDVFNAVDELTCLAYRQISRKYGTKIEKVHGANVLTAQIHFTKSLPIDLVGREELTSLLEKVPSIRDHDRYSPLREALIDWIASRVGKLSPERQKAVLRHLFTVCPDQTHITLKGITISDADFLAFLRTTPLKELTLEGTSLTLEGVHQVVSSLPDLALVIELNSEPGCVSLQEVIELAQKEQRKLSLLLGGKAVSCLESRWTIFYEALKVGETAIADALYDRGCIEQEDPFILHSMAAEGCPASLRYLIAKHESLYDPRALHTKDDDKTLLHSAAQAGNAPNVEYLIKELKAPIDHFDRKRRTPLLLATLGGHLEAAKVLIRKGHDPNIRTGDGQSFLHLAASVRLGETDSELAASARRVAFANFFFGQGIAQRWLNKRDRDGNTPLHRAVQHPEFVALLLRNGAEVDPQNNKGWTPLLYAIRHRIIDSVRHLLAAGAQPDCRYGMGDSALTLALDVEVQSDYREAEGNLERRITVEEEMDEIAYLILSSGPARGVDTAASTPPSASPATASSTFPPRSGSRGRIERRRAGSASSSSAAASSSSAAAAGSTSPPARHRFALPRRRSRAPSTSSSSSTISTSPRLQRRPSLGRRRSSRSSSSSSLSRGGSFAKLPRPMSLIRRRSSSRENGLFHPDETGDAVRDALAYLKHARVKLESGQFKEAALLVHHTLRWREKLTPSLDSLLDIEQERIEKRFCQYYKMTPIERTESGWHETDRIALTNIRNAFYRELVESEKTVFQAQEQLSKNIREFIASVVREYTARDDFALVATGELADGAFPYFSLHLHFVLREENDENRAYINLLGDLLRMRALGWDTTVQAAKLVESEEDSPTEEPGTLIDTGRRQSRSAAFATRCLVAGNGDLMGLLPVYKDRAHFLKRHRNTTLMKRYVDQCKPREVYGDIVDLEEDLSNPIRTGIDGLLCYYGSGPQPIDEGINWLIAEEKVPTELGGELMWTLTKVTEWRVKAQQHYKMRCAKATIAKEEAEATTYEIPEPDFIRARSNVKSLYDYVEKKCPRRH